MKQTGRHDIRAVYEHLHLFHIQEAERARERVRESKREG